MLYQVDLLLMFIISRLNLLFSSMLKILLKIIVAVSKGFYSIVLKVYNKIEFSFKRSENSHFSQNVHQSGMDSFKNPHLSSTRSRYSDIVDVSHESGFDDFLIYNLPIGRKVTLKHLRKYEIDSSQILCDNPQQWMTVQGPSHLVCKEFANAVDGKIFINNSDCSSPLLYVHATSQSEVKLQNQANSIENLKKCLNSSQNGKHANTKIFVKASGGNSLQLDTLYGNIKSYLNKRNQTKNDTSECDPRNMPLPFVEHSNKIRSSPSEDSNLRQRMQLDITSRNKKVECAYSEENKTIQSGEIPYFEDEKTNSDSDKHLRKHEAPDSSQISCHSPQQRMTVLGTSHPVCKDRVNAVDEKTYINHSSCSSPLVYVRANSKNEVKLQIQSNREIEIVEDMEKSPVNMKLRENFTEKDLLSSDTYYCTNKFVEPSDSMEKLLKVGKTAYIDFLVKAKPIILAIENALVNLFKRCQQNPVLLIRTGLEFTKHCFQPLKIKSSVMNNYAYHTVVVYYTVKLSSVFIHLTETQLYSSRSEKRQNGLSNLDVIRRTLVQERYLLWVNDEECINVFTEKQVAKASRPKTAKRKSWK